LAILRPESQKVQQCYFEALLVQAKKFGDRGLWSEALKILEPLVPVIFSAGGKAGYLSQQQPVFLNFLGCGYFMIQDFEQAIRYFSQALKGPGAESPWLYQNLALSFEQQKKYEKANLNWSQYLDSLRKKPPKGLTTQQISDLEFETLCRLAELHTKKERWDDALSFLKQARRVRPNDSDILDRLFHLYNQLGQADEARKTLEQLRTIKPHDPQFDLYELDLRQLRSAEDIEQVLGELRRALQRHPNDLRVEEKTTAVIDQVIPMLEKLIEHTVVQVTRVTAQMSRLANYQINWAAVSSLMRDMENEFLRLRRACNRSLQLANNNDQCLILKKMITRIDKKLELCHSLSE
jgi:tetratricopeptide (TPR) repeat protein